MKKNPLKIVWLTAAFLCLGIGAIGVILPILPTTPFLLVASFCFARGSERFHKWFMGTKLYKNHLDSFVKRTRHDTKNEILYSASGIRNADVCIFDDEQSAGAYFYSSVDSF